MSCRGGLLGAALTLAFLALPAAGHAEFLTGINDTNYYTSTDDSERQRSFDQTVDLEAGIVRLDIVWSAVVSGEPAKPSDPADPAYDFSGYDAAVLEAAERNLKVMVTFYKAPAYAEGEDRPNDTASGAGAWKPGPAQLGDFARAVATRYSGAYAGLPAVRHYDPWNEPNLELFLAPQYEKGESFAPDHYRRMVAAVDEAVSAVDPANKVIAGSTAPYGDPPRGFRTRPVTFLRELLCLSKKLERTACPVKARFDIIGHHPINLSGPPRQSAVDPKDVSSPDLDAITEVVRAAEREQTIAGARKRHPLWVTEFWWESFPDRGLSGAISGLKVHGRWIQESLYLFWKARARVAINLQLTDSPNPDQGNSFQAGLQLVDGTPKPAYTSFRFPFVTERRSKGPQLFAWGKAPVSGKLTIERKQGKNWKRVKRLSVKDGKVFTTKLSERGKATYRARIGDDTSLPWRQGKRRDKIIEPSRVARPLAGAPASRSWIAERPSN